MNHRFTIAMLGELLAVTRDGERGFGACAQHTRNEKLQKMLMSRSARLTAASAELRALLVQLGGESGLSRDSTGATGATGAIPGVARRGWINLRAALAVLDDEALMDQCEHGGDHALEVYRNALDDPLPE